MPLAFGLTLSVSLSIILAILSVCRRRHPLTPISLPQIVGVMNDEEIIRTKGSAPVMNEEERYECLAANRFVTEVIR